MNKYAAEKIAEEYYNLGIELALEKVANILNPKSAKLLAESLGKTISGARKVTSGAGPLRRLSGYIPGTQMNKAQQVLGGAGGRANLSYAENAHNLGLGRLGGGRPTSSPGNVIVPAQRYQKAVAEGMIPKNYKFQWHETDLPLSSTLKAMPEEFSMYYKNPYKLSPYT